MVGPTEAWSRGGDYEAFMGRWSRRVAGDFLAWLAADPALRWLDVGSGTGALSGAIVERTAPAAVTGVDASANYVAAARRRETDPRVRFAVGDAHDLPFTDEFDVVVSGLMLNFAEDAGSVLASLRRAVEPGGVVAAYVWDYAGRMDLLQHFWTAASALNPAARSRDEAVRFAAWNAAHLTTLWREAGLREVQTTAISIRTDLRGFDDYWLPFLGGQGPAPGYLASLDAGRRTALRDAIRARLPIGADGSLSLRATAWAVRGLR